MLLAVERVALLRHVDLFAQTPGRVLAGIARVLEEIEYSEDAVLMEAGAVEDWLFVIVEGDVEVVREDRRVRMGPGSVVGEMAVLDPQPRSATVRAATPVRAFRLRKAAFDQALRMRPEIAAGVITELVRRLRETHEHAPGPVRTRLLLLGGQTVGLGLLMAFLVVPVSALFLNEYGAGALAYVYLTVAAVGVAVSASLSRAQRRVSLAAMTAGVFWIYLVVVAAGWLVLTAWDGVWVTFPLLVLFPLTIPIGFALVGGQAGRLLDVRQMKAHFPRVAAGFSVGFAVGGIAAALLVEPLGGPKRLIGVDLLASLVMVGLVVATGRRYPAELAAAPEPAPPGRSVADRRALLRNRLVVLIFGYQVLSAAVTQLLDFMVWERAAARYPDPSDLARFQGVFAAIINVSSIVFIFVFAGWILTRFGIGVGLALNPVVVFALLCVTSVTGVAVGPTAFAFFALVCVQQVTDITLTDGTTRTSINATYQALLPRLRLQAQTMTEATGIPIALGLVGGLLIVQDALNLDVRAVRPGHHRAHRDLGDLRGGRVSGSTAPTSARCCPVGRGTRWRSASTTTSRSPLIESLLTAAISGTRRRRSKPWSTPAAPPSRLTSPD